MLRDGSQTFGDNEVRLFLALFKVSFAYGVFQEYKASFWQRIEIPQFSKFSLKKTYGEALTLKPQANISKKKAFVEKLKNVNSVEDIGAMKKFWNNQTKNET